MSFLLDRRGFLKSSAVAGSAFLSCGVPLDRSADAAPVRIEAPIIDKLTIREITDNTHDIFLSGAKLPGLVVGRTGFPAAAQGETLESEWGLALHIESMKGSEARRFLLDFGYTPDVYANNVKLMKINLAEVDALIISHGHYDHIGGLMGLLQVDRSRMRKGWFCRKSSPKTAAVYDRRQQVR
jgi:7,8-dihydropterin-6-yl-methyl-4-(beta-D-ribofuranosyl)aminobenzene 5'-phosphate synthase